MVENRIRVQEMMLLLTYRKLPKTELFRIHHAIVLASYFLHPHKACTRLFHCLDPTHAACSDRRSRQLAVA